MVVTAAPYTTISSGYVAGTWTIGTYYIAGDITVADDATLSIDAGCVIKFSPGAQLWVSGTLDVNGEMGNEIIFTSRDDDTYGQTISGSDGVPTNGDWDGVYFYGSDAHDGIGYFDYSRIRYGGSASVSPYAGIFYYSDGAGYFKNSIVEKSAYYGMYLSYCDASIISIESSTFQDCGNVGLISDGWSRHSIINSVFNNNTGYGGYLQGGILVLYHGNTGSGNTINGMRLDGTQSENGYWASPGSFPLVMTSDVSISSGVTITIAAGSVFKATSSGRLFVSGTVDVNGTSDSIVTFTSLKDDTYGGNSDGDAGAPAAGDWDGIRLYGDGSYEGTGFFDYCRLRYGGVATWGGVYANVEFYKSDAGNFTNSVAEYGGDAGISIESCSPTISYSTIQNNATYGIYAQGGTLSAPVITNNTIDNNSNYAVYLNSIVPTAYSGNSGTGNTPNTFGWYGDVTSSLTISGTLPFELIYPVTVASGQTLTVSSGSLLCEGYAITGAGHFTLSSAALLGTKNVYGFTATSDYGAIRVSGTRSYSQSANYLYNGTSAQETGDGLPSSVLDLTIWNSAGVTLTSNTTVTGVLHMFEGNLNTGANTITVGSSTSTLGDVDASGGTVNGTMKRWFAASTISDAAFPVGTASKYLPAAISFTSAPISGGTITAKFYASDPTSNGLPVVDGAASIVNYASEGYWSLLSGDGLTGGTYSLDLTTDAFAGVSDFTKLHILKRANSSSNWSVEGSHAEGTGSNEAAVAHRTGLTSFSEFAIGSTNENSLPVEITAFTAMHRGVGAFLQWSTATETNNYGFEIERKTIDNGKLIIDNWKKIGFVRGVGSTNVPQTYSFSDQNLLPGKYSYRLKQIDRDGRSAFSKTVEMAIVSPKEFLLYQNFPNPFNPTTTISYNLVKVHNLDKVPVTLKIYDAIGREVAVLVNEMKEAGTYEVPFDGSTLESGIYFVRLVSGTQLMVRKMLLVK